MNIVHVSASLSAQSACTRLHNAMLGQGVNSHVLVLHPTEGIENLSVLNNTAFKAKFVSRIISALNSLPLKLFYKNRDLQYPFSNFSFGHNILRRKIVQEADVIHLHWICGSLLSYNNLKKLFNTNKRIIWTFHDSWAFTGGCHVKMGCNKFLNGCGYCPALKSNDSNDLSSKTYNKKSKLYKEGKFSVITPSQWMLKNAQLSTLLTGKLIRAVPNTLNTDLFKPFDKLVCREAIKSDPAKFVFLIGAYGIGYVKYKGLELFIEALMLLKIMRPDLQDKIEIIVFGADSSEELNRTEFLFKYLGVVDKEQMMVNCYNAADVFITPSIDDNFPNTVLESLSCGTPVLAFTTGGIPEMVQHKVNGFIAIGQNPASMAEGMVWLFEQNLEPLKTKARESVLQRYAESMIVKKHLEMYSIAND